MATTLKRLVTDRIEKLFVHDIEIEKTILHCLLFSEKAREDINRINTEDFYNLSNQSLFKMLRDFIKEKKNFDIYTVPMEIKSNRTYIMLFGRETIFSMWDLYLEKFKEISARRKLQKIAYRLTCKAEETNSIQTIKKKVIEEIEEIEVGGRYKFSIQNREIEEEFLKFIDSEEPKAHSTGFSTLDSIIGGLYPGSFYIIGGIPAAGKTTLLLNMTCFLCKQGKTVLLVSLEMPHLEINGKIISYLTGISSEIIRKQGKQEDKILKEIMSALATINTYNLARMKVGAIAVADIEDEIKNLGGVDVVFIDYLQRIEPIFHKNTRYEQITQISNDLKTLAVKLNIPVVAIASINRTFTVRADKVPRLSDFRGSGDIEYDVDVALLLYRKSQFEKQTGGSDPVSVIIGKNRYGRAGLHVDMVFKPEKSRYYEIEQESKKIKGRKDINGQDDRKNS